MDLVKKIDFILQDEMTSGATTSSNVVTNTAKGSIDVIGGECPKGQVYDKVKKVCVPSKKNESSVSGMVVGSGQTRIWGVKRNLMPDLNRKEPVEVEMDDPSDENIIGRKALRFNKLTGAYTPSLWRE
jgi:hypothetical protein